jgi:hypothetical protein
MIIFLSGSLIFESESIFAANFYIQNGEGRAGLDAWLELDESNQLRLAMMGCRKSRKRFNLQLGLYVSDSSNVPSELEKLRNTQKNTKLDLLLCINRICEERQWELRASGFGDAFFTNLSIDQNRGPIRAIRVIIPNESRKYEYRDDVEDILQRICKR